MKWQPHPYQRRAVKMLLRNPAAGLLLDPGLGKTSVALTAFDVLRRENVVDSMLVLAPLLVAQQVWRQEAEKWDHLRHLRFELLHGPKKTDALHQPADVYLINYEGLAWLAKQRWRWPQMLVADESTRIKHTGTARFKVLKPQLAKAHRRVILTGTPVPNGLEDLFGQVYFLDLGERLGRYVTHYRTRFFVPVNKFEWRPRPDALEEIEETIGDICLRMENADYLDLPVLIKRDVEIDLPRPARQIYRELEERFYTELDSGRITVANAAVKSGKLRQLVGGGVYDEDGETWHDVHDAKLERLASLLEELGGAPTIVAYEFQHELTRLLEHFPGAEVLQGTRSKRQALIEEWNAGQVPLMLLNPASAAHGLNLQAGGHHLVWFCLPWNLEHYDQTIGRLWRQGQKQRVFVYHLMARGTIDALVSEVLSGKDHTQQELLRRLKERNR